jgi:hypothetical protein
LRCTAAAAAAAVGCRCCELVGTFLETVPYINETPGSSSSRQLNIDALVQPLVELLAPAASAQDVKLMAKADPQAWLAGQDPAAVAEKRGQVIQGLFATGRGVLCEPRLDI